MPDSLPHVTCIILNYNEWAMTQSCIESVLNQSHKNLSIILIDNQSQTVPPHIILNGERYPLFHQTYRRDSFETKITAPDSQIITIQSDKNGGFSYGTNIGLTYARDHLNTDYIWLLNNDTTCQENTLTELLMQATPHHICCSKLMSLDHQLLRSFCYIHPQLGTSHACNTTDSHPLSYAPFTSVLIPMALVQLVGNLDEQFFLYYEDADFCIRAMQHHARFRLCESSIVYHNESYSSSKDENEHLCPDWLAIYSKKQFMKKHQFNPIFIVVSLFLSFLKRLAQCKFRSAFLIIKLITNDSSLIKKHPHYS